MPIFNAGQLHLCGLNSLDVDDNSRLAAVFAYLRLVDGSPITAAVLSSSSTNISYSTLGQCMRTSLYLPTLV